MDELYHKLTHCDTEDCIALIREGSLPCECVDGHPQKCGLCYGDAKHD